MKLTLLISDDRRYMISKREGIWTRKDRQDHLRHLQEIQELGESLGTHHYLADLTETQLDLSIVDLFELFNYDVPENTRIRSLARIAFLVAPEDHSFDCLEVLGRNAGYNVQVFRDREKAIRFLTKHAAQQYTKAEAVTTPQIFV